MSRMQNRPPKQLSSVVLMTVLFSETVLARYGDIGGGGGDIGEIAFVFVVLSLAYIAEGFRKSRSRGLKAMAVSAAMLGAFYIWPILFYVAAAIFILGALVSVIADQF